VASSSAFDPEPGAPAGDVGEVSDGFERWWSRSRIHDPPVDGAFHYTRPLRPDALRAISEEALVLGIGYAQYATNKGNEADWDVGTDWPGFRSKLVLGSASFDDNRFDTNWLTHPLAGFLYYTAARSNQFKIIPSFAVAVTSSSLWELVGEVREQIAINDLIATPVAGVALGEPLLQLGNLMHRSKPTVLSTGLGWLFAPFKSVHDALDGAVPMRASSFDANGLPADVWHRFIAGVAYGSTSQQAGPTQEDGRMFVESRVVALPDHGRAAQHLSTFDSGEVTSLRLQAARSASRWVDFGLGAHVLPAGVYWQDITGEAGALHGASVIGGLDIGAEYSRHDYDRDRRRGEDRIALVTSGVSVEVSAYRGPFVSRARLDLLGSFGGIDAYAFPDYRRRAGTDGLTSVLAKQGYYHSYGATVRPTLLLGLGPVDSGIDLRVDSFRSINGLDVDDRGGQIRVADARVSARAWLGAALCSWLRLSVAAERNERTGRVGATHASRSERGVYGGAEVVF
jgi:hypothetical protein